MMGLPSGLAALVRDLERCGFRVESEKWFPWPGGGVIELAAPRRVGVKWVRMTEDRGLWDVKVTIGRGWYEPFEALRALDEQPHEQRALSHEERRNATLELVKRFTGKPEQVKAIKARHNEFVEAYTRWAQGESNRSGRGDSG